MIFTPSYQVAGWRFTYQMLQMRLQDMELAARRQGRNTETDPEMLALKDTMHVIARRIINLDAEGKHLSLGVHVPQRCR